MALPKVCGIETEYGIVVRGGENNPGSASAMLINAYVAATMRERGRIGWDFEDEQPANDARGFSLDDALAHEVEPTLVNAVLTNGARNYVAHAHPARRRESGRKEEAGRAERRDAPLRARVARRLRGAGG